MLHDQRLPRWRRNPDVEGRVRALPSMLAGFVAAVALAVGLEFSQGFSKPWPAAWERLGDLGIGSLGVSVVVVWALILALQALTNRIFVSIMLLTGFVTLVGVANHHKLAIRAEPVFASDIIHLGQMGLLTENVGVAPFLVVLAPLAILLAGVIWHRRLEHADPRPRRGIIRAVSGALALATLVTASQFNAQSNPLRGAYEIAGVRWRPWNQSQNYWDNGVIPGLLYNLPASPIDKPDGYSKARIQELLDEYTVVARSLNADRDASALSDTNIVVVLSESLSDPLALPALTAEADPLPYLRQLMAENTSGTLLSGGFGGGTSNVEFEVLTGMAVANLNPQVDSPFPGLVAQTKDFPSHLRQLGMPERATSTIHPYAAEFYRRNVVYPALGFEQMAFNDSLGHLSRLPGDNYTSDAAVFEEVLKTIDATDGPSFINVVTMQNHNPQKGLADPIPVFGPLDEQQAESGAQYLRGLKHTDEALEGFISALRMHPERTIVLFYGDHLPSLWPEAVLESGGPTARYETPWVVFANFPTNNIDAGKVGANQLMNQLVDAAGAPHTPWTALLDSLAEELPAMERTAWLDGSGAQTHEVSLSDAARKVLQDYRMVQYVLIAGQGTVADEFFTVPE